MITSYNELTINKYLEIREILEEDGGELNIQSRIIACLADMDVDEVLNLTLTKYNEMVQKSAFLMSKPQVKSSIPSKISINGRECHVTKNVNKLTAAQYIDYQTLAKNKDMDKVLPNVLACFVVPDGFKYGDGYDVEEIVEWIGNNMSIQDALNICFFFRKKYLNLIRRTLVYLEVSMRMMKRKMSKNPQMKEQMEELTTKLKEMRQLSYSVGAGLK